LTPGSLKFRQEAHVRLRRALLRTAVTVDVPSAAVRSGRANGSAPADAEPNSAGGAKLKPVRLVTRQSGLYSSPLWT
jgi:hypothetical protein